MNLTGRVQNDLQTLAKRPPPRPYNVPRTWVMIADQHIARLFWRHGRGLEPIGTALPDPRNAEISNKSVGRILSSAGRSIHHKYEPHMNESRQKNLAFAGQIADWLHRAVREDAFDRLVLVAAPRMLGDLRKAITGPVQQRIYAELNKDLTRLDLGALEEELERKVFP